MQNKMSELIWTEPLDLRFLLAIWHSFSCLSRYIVVFWVLLLTLDVRKYALHIAKKVWFGSHIL